MGALFEPLILYMVLFLSGSIGQIPDGEFITVSITGELSRIILYNIPSLALIWHLLLKDRNFSAWGIGRPALKDLLPALIALAALILTGFTIALVSPYFSEIPRGPKIFPPSGIIAWIVLSVSCISTGYLEESFFRFYLLSKRDAMGLPTIPAALLSTLLFSICHIYEGPWGFLNAVLSGILLAFIFIRYRSLHGVALAHGLYNIAAYALGAL